MLESKACVRNPPRHRIAFDVDEDLKRRIDKQIPWGIRNQMMIEVMDQIVAAIEQGGMAVCYYIISRKLPLFISSSGGGGEKGVKLKTNEDNGD